MKRFHSIRTTGLFLIFVLVNGCATLSRETCNEGNWFGIGYDDGLNGYQYTRIIDHTRACREYNIAPNEQEYNRGWNEGVVIYCTKENGYDEGQDMEKYQGNCPSHLEQSFLKGYLMGLDAAEIELQQDISRKNREIMKATVLLQELKDQKYKDQLEKIERLEREIKAIEKDISDIYELRRKFAL